MALAAARNGRVTVASAAPNAQRPAQPLLRRAALHHGGEQLARAQRAYEPSSLGAARAPPLGSAQRRRVPAPASHPQQRWQRCCGLGSSAVLRSAARGCQTIDKHADQGADGCAPAVPFPPNSRSTRDSTRCAQTPAR